MTAILKNICEIWSEIYIILNGGVLILRVYMGNNLENSKIHAVHIRDNSTGNILLIWSEICQALDVYNNVY